MSTASRFLTDDIFPFCVEDISGEAEIVDAPASFVGNLTLAQALQFYWNFEGFTMTSTGTTSRSGHTLDASGHVTTTPFGSSFADGMSNVLDCSWYGNSFGFTDTVPDIRQPFERVCQPGSIGRMMAAEYKDLADILGRLIIYFWLGTDPSNAGKYRVYYYFNILHQASGAFGALTMAWTNDPSVPTGNSLQASGTITIAGLTLNWYCYYNSNAGATATGGSLTASSTSFSY